MQAARKGEGFDTAAGQPESAARQQQSITWFDLACRYVDLKWPHVAAKSRTSIADALATVTPVLVTSTRGMPDAATLRSLLYGWAFHKTRRETSALGNDEAAALAWVRDHALIVSVLDDPERRIRSAPAAPCPPSRSTAGPGRSSSAGQTYPNGTDSTSVWPLRGQ